MIPCGSYLSQQLGPKVGFLLGIDSHLGIIWCLVFRFKAKVLARLQPVALPRMIGLEQSSHGILLGVLLGVGVCVGRNSCVWGILNSWILQVAKGT